jgi:chemotaxis protein methyltransferase CheR
MDAETVNLEVELLIEAVYVKFQYDFRQYSRSSLRRRLEQAKLKFNVNTISELQNKLLHEEDFFPKLLAYMTVNTTELFRDPEYFQTLKEKVFPFLKTFPSIKVWIAGCSTGEEVVSLAILLKEANIKRCLIYATDINPLNLEAAKRGIYPAEHIKKATKNYQMAGGSKSLSDYFDMAYDSVKFHESIYENVVFSDHSLATDSVFSEIHFVSCRNVLIYFDRPLQDRAFSLFSESLVRGGFLGLGNKETIQFSNIKDDFTVIDQVNRLFQKKNGLS